MNNEQNLDFKHTYNSELIFYTNLQLLGFKDFKQSNEIKNYRSSKVELVLDETMFQDSKQRQKAAEIVIYFLWSKIEPISKIRDILFPPSDIKESREFRSSCFKWLEQVRPALSLPSHIFLRLSDLEDCHSERFYSTIHELAIYAIKVCLKSKVNNIDSDPRSSRISIRSDTSSLTVSELKNEIQSTSSSYLNMLNSHSQIQKDWLQKASQLSRATENLLKERSTSEDDLCFYKNSYKELNPSYEYILEKMKNSWQFVDSELDSIKPHCESVAAIAENRAIKCQLDGDSILASGLDNSQTPFENPLLRKRTLDSIIEAFGKKFKEKNCNSVSDSQALAKKEFMDITELALSNLVKKHKQSLEELSELKRGLKEKLCKFNT